MRFIFLIISIICFGNISAISLSIPSNYKNKISILIMDNSTGKILYSHEIDKPRLIASNMKLFTTALGLQQLKPDFRWHTELFYSGVIENGVLNGNLFLKGGGDPTLDDKAIYQIFSELKRLKIKQINGDIIFDESIFTTKPSFSMLENIAYDPDTVLPNGIIINNNLAQFKFNIEHNKVFLSTNLYKYPIENHLSVSSDIPECNNLLKIIQVNIKKPINASEIEPQNIIELKGKIPPKCNDSTLALNLLPNFEYNSMIINRVLADFSINLQGKFILAKTPETAKLIIDFTSDSLEEILIRMNRFSDNLMAETILLSLGSFDNKVTDNFKVSATIFNKFIEKNQLGNKKFKLENGAGLSRHEYFSAKNIADLLHLIAHSPLQANFEATLSEPALEGTLQDRLLNFKRVLHAKTGMLNDVRALSGYFYTPKNKYIISIIANDLDGQNLDETKNFDSLINNLLTQIK